MKHTRKLESLPDDLRSAADELIAAKFPAPKRRSVTHRARPHGKTWATFGNGKPVEVSNFTYSYNLFDTDSLDTGKWNILPGHTSSTASFAMGQTITLDGNIYESGTHL